MGVSKIGITLERFPQLLDGHVVLPRASHFVNTPKLVGLQGTGPLGGAITESTTVTLANP